MRLIQIEGDPIEVEQTAFLSLFTINCQFDILDILRTRIQNSAMKPYWTGVEQEP